MKKFVIAASAVALLLSGCTSTQPESPAETQGSTNEPVQQELTACEQFESATETAVGAYDTEQEDIWEQARQEIDAASETATGEVAEHISSAIDSWPDFTVLHIGTHEAFALSERFSLVEAACASAGEEVTAHLLEEL